MAKSTITENELADTASGPDRLHADEVDAARIVVPDAPRVDMLGRLRRGALQIVALGCGGLVAGAAIVYGVRRAEPVTSTARVVFSFPGFDRGEYPDHSHFQPDDLRAPHVIREALQRQGLDTSPAVQARIRNALSIEGTVTPGIVSERDRRRASGQTPAPYVPDEYVVRFTPPRETALERTQRERLLEEIIAVYRDHFRRTYGEIPTAFSQAFQSLSGVDYAEYELIFTKAVGSVRTYLQEQAEIAGSFRSPTTHLSFQDLLEQTELFSEIHLNEVLGLIHEHGLSRNRDLARAKMDYYLRLLGHQEGLALEQEKLIKGLLARAQGLSSDYVVGIKAQAAQSASSTTPLLDQSLIDSLLANDASNFLIREALETGTKVKQIQAEKAKLLHTRESMQAFLGSDPGDQSVVVAQVSTSLAALEAEYLKLLGHIQATYADFAQQRYGDAIRLTAPARTMSVWPAVASASAIGAGLGTALGAGLSLLGFYLMRRRGAGLA